MSEIADPFGGASVQAARPDDAELTQKLRDAGLRPTQQRMTIARLLFAGIDRHLSAEDVHALVRDQAEQSVSLATIYNTLNQFTHAGLLREVAVDGSRTYFDTNVDDHHHFFVEDENRMVDVPRHEVHVDRLPTPPEGMEIARVDVVIRLRPQARN